MSAHKHTCAVHNHDTRVKREDGRVERVGHRARRLVGEAAATGGGVGRRGNEHKDALAGGLGAAVGRGE
jgi:hypothetical protein